MPIYTYRCEECGVQFERTQKFSDAALTRCPECGKKSLRKVYTPVGIVFKGSGFYSTDNRSPSGAPRPGSSGDGKPTESKPTESKPTEGKTTEGKTTEGKTTESKPTDSGSTGTDSGASSNPKQND
jgi:putative FmdB family regulatory protein